MFEEVFLSDLTQFSQRNNVLHAAASTLDGFLQRGRCVSFNEIIGLCGIK